MNKSVAQPRNGNDGTREYWVDGGCTNHDASGRERRAHASCSDAKTIERFNFPEARTSNEAEYRTLIELLSTLQDGAVPTIRMDSKLLVGQLTKGWRVRAENLKPLHKRAKELVRSTRARLTWLPRTEVFAKLGH